MAKEQSPNDPDLLVDEELLNLDEFPEEIPDLLGLSDAEEEPELSFPHLNPEAEEEEIRPTSSDGQGDSPLRMVGWVYKKAPGKAPEVQVVEAPAVEPERMPEKAEPAEEMPIEETEEPESKEERLTRLSADEEDEDDLPPAWIWEKARERVPTLTIGDEEEEWAAEEAEEDSGKPKPTWAGVFHRMVARRRKKHGAPPKNAAPAESGAVSEDEASREEKAAPDLSDVESPVDQADTISEGDMSEEETEPPKKRTPLFQTLPEPDVPPRHLTVLYGNRLESRRRNLMIAAVLLIPLIYLNLSDSMNLPIPVFLWDDALLTAMMLEILGITVLLLGSAFAKGFLDLFRGKPGLHTIISFAVVLTAADGLVLIFLGREGPLPCVSGASMALLFSALGQYMNQKAQRISCRTAAMTDHPGRLSLLQEDGQTTDLLLKYRGNTDGFGSQIQESNGVQRRTGPLSLLLLLFAVLFMILASIGQDEPEMAFWCGSVIFLLSAPLAATLAYGLPWYRTTERLNRVGCALAGWDGVRALKDAHLIAVTDDDIFPTGMISCNGIQFYGNVQAPLAVGYAATLVKAAGGGLTDTFDKLVYSQGAKYWLPQLYDFRIHDEGGYYGQINGADVLLGTSEFMSLMDVPLPDGISVKTAAFCAIDGELAAQFALVYKMPGYVQPAIKAFQRNGYQLVLVSRDFNLTARMLLQNYSIPIQDIQFPEAEVRLELAAAADESEGTLGAVLAREGLDAHCDAVLSAKLLDKVARQNARWAGAAAVLGLLLGAYLTTERAYTALQPLNVLIYMLLWLVPCLLNSHKATRF